MRVYIGRIAMGIAAIWLHAFQQQAMAAPEAVNTPPPVSPSFCAAPESTLFSCTIGKKTLSLCTTLQPGTQKAEHLTYRFGVLGKPPELAYPTGDVPMNKAFSFVSPGLPTSRYMQTVSFDNGVAYDVIMPDKREDIESLPFIGVSVTLPGRASKLIACEPQSITTDLAPLKNALGIASDASFSEALPKVQFDAKPYPIVKREATHGKNWKSEWTYPTVNDPTVSHEIHRFARDCYKSEEDLRDGYRHECARVVTATLVKEAFLNLTFETYEYNAPAGHGISHRETSIYRKSQGLWKLIDTKELLDPSERCQARVASLVYRQLRPQQLSNLDKESVEPQDILLADISLGAQGVVFAYQAYELGSYAEGLWPVTVSYASLGRCFRGW